MIFEIIKFRKRKYSAMSSEMEDNGLSQLLRKEKSTEREGSGWRGSRRWEILDSVVYRYIDSETINYAVENRNKWIRVITICGN